MAAYTDFAYYSGTYLGNQIQSADFARLALRASAAIDNLTYRRASAIVTANTDTETIDLIKMAVCAVADEIQRQEMTGDTDGIQSESIGANSVTYAPGALAQMSGLQRQERSAKLYLQSTGLMFKGFATGEYSG